MLKPIIDKRLRALEAKRKDPVEDEVEQGKRLNEVLREFQECRRTGKPMPAPDPIDPDHPLAAAYAAFLA